LLIFVSLTIIF